jgi:hypothetical protein
MRRLKLVKYHTLKTPAKNTANTAKGYLTPDGHSGDSL